MLTDIQIASSAKMRPVTDIAKDLNIPEEAIYSYGPNMAKIDPLKLPENKAGKLILVTAINPTAAGEGKTTVSIGLADGLREIGKNSILALREPSMGPVFGVKGGAAGGGYSQVVPMEEINLHFTGDFHAITTANNLVAALIDNHIQKGNDLGFDRVVWRRCMDMNDRQLRFIVDGLNGKSNGVPREDGFDITTASEMMAAFCLANDLDDLRVRLSRLVLGYTKENKAITAGELGGVGSLMVVLKRALQPNLVQTLINTPAFIHGGPFANIAHGCNSVIATRTAMQLADYTVTEAGFGADLGAEKFLDIKCRMSGLAPSAVVIVATVRALKSHGGVAKADLNAENLDALQKGMGNLIKHIENMKNVWGVQPIVAINKFVSDTDAETKMIVDACAAAGAKAIPANVWGEGGKGAVDLAKAVAEVVDATASPSVNYAYPLDAPYSEKIRAVAQKVYGADDVTFTPQALTQLAQFDDMFPGWPVCMAKTQYSLTDDVKVLGRPTGFNVTIRNARVSSGAGFIVAFCGDIIAMPGLPKVPAAMSIDIDENGETVGLF